MSAPNRQSLGETAEGAADAVRALRSALVAGDVEAAQAHRWLRPRPPGERDLLSDLAAAEGIAPAVRRLSRFWKRAEVRLEAVRAVSELEAEVYERVILPGENLPISTLVRRTGLDQPWGVVCTNEALDERLSLWVVIEADAIDDVAWSRTFAEPGQLLMTDDGGVIGHPEEGWLVHVRGPYTPAAWPDNLSGEGSHIVELAMALTPSHQSRREQLRWLLSAAATTLDILGGHAAYRPAEQKMLVPQALRVAARGALSPSQAFQFWARTDVMDAHVVTQGLHLLGLPEVEAAETLAGDVDGTIAVVEWVAASLIAAEGALALGTELVFGADSAVLTNGRRGPRRGVSYGRWGAYQLSTESDAFGRGSRTRMRVPDEIFG